MTERGAAQVEREHIHALDRPKHHALERGLALRLSVDERLRPLAAAAARLDPLDPTALTDSSFALDGAGRHRWSPHCAVRPNRGPIVRSRSVVVRYRVFGFEFRRRAAGGCFRRLDLVAGHAS